jgi:hypothetical protein
MLRIRNARLRHRRTSACLAMTVTPCTPTSSTTESTSHLAGHTPPPPPPHVALASNAARAPPAPASPSAPPQCTRVSTQLLPHRLYHCNCRERLIPTFPGLLPSDCSTNELLDLQLSVDCFIAFTPHLAAYFNQVLAISRIVWLLRKLSIRREFPRN